MLQEKNKLRNKPAKRAAAAAVLALLVCAGVFNIVRAQKTYAAIGGSGTANSPYIITTEAELKEFAGYINAGTSPWRNSDKYYKLTADISLSGSWTPIGTSNWPFMGNFNGGGHKITGLNINNGSNNQGLFGFINGGTVQNLGLESVNVKSKSKVGAVTANLNGGTISHCYVTGSVSGESSVGGIAGIVENNGRIKSCYVTGSVSGGSITGGIAGYVFPGGIENCYTTCAVTGASNIGGIAGTLASASTLCYMENCYSTGAVKGDSYVGGLSGAMMQSPISIKNSVALNPNVSGSSSTGRITGNKSGTLGSNYALDEITNKNGTTVWNNKAHNNIDGEDLTAEGSLEASFWTETVLWNTDVWYVMDGMLPILKNVGGTQAMKTIFIVSINHSPDGMNATILIKPKEGES